MKTDITTGNFKLSIEGELNAEQTAAVLEAGLTYIVQRDVLSKSYKTLLGKDEKRSDLAFSAENGGKFETAATKALEDYGTFTVDVSEHVPSEGGVGARAMATQMWEKVKDNAVLRTNLGVPAKASDDAGIEACHTFLSGLRKTPVRKPKAEAPAA